MNSFRCVRVQWIEEGSYRLWWAIIAYVLAKLPTQKAAAERDQESVINVLAATHALLASRPKAAKTPKSDTAQLDLL